MKRNVIGNWIDNEGVINKGKSDKKKRFVVIQLRSGWPTCTVE